MSDVQRKIESLRTEMAARKEAMREARELNALSDPKIVEAKIKAELRDEEIDKLRTYIEQCQHVVESVPVYDTRTRTQRKWNRSAAYQFDTAVQLLTNLCNNIQYSPAEHKELMLNIVPLSVATVEQVANMFNRNSRYSNIQDTIIEGTAGNEEKFKDMFRFLTLQLGVEFNLDQFDQDKLDYHEKVAYARAEKMQAQHEEAKELHQQSLTL
jgi:hypothetical protein